MPDAAIGVVIAAVVSGIGSLVVAIVTLVSGSRTLRRQLDAGRETARLQRTYAIEDAWRDQRHHAHAALLLLLEPAVVRQRASAALFARSGEQVTFEEIRTMYLRVLDEVNNELNRALTQVLLLGGDDAMEKAHVVGSTYQRHIITVANAANGVSSLPDLQRLTEQTAPPSGHHFHEEVGEYLEAVR